VCIYREGEKEGERCEIAIAERDEIQGEERKPLSKGERRGARRSNKRATKQREQQKKKRERLENNAQQKSGRGSGQHLSMVVTP